MRELRAVFRRTADADPVGVQEQEEEEEEEEGKGQGTEEPRSRPATCVVVILCFLPFALFFFLCLPRLAPSSPRTKRTRKRSTVFP